MTSTLDLSSCALPSRPLTRMEAHIRERVFRGDYPNSSETNSYTSRSELDEITRWLKLTKDALLADLGCGRGGPGRYVSGRAGCSLIGIDQDVSAIEYANARGTQPGSSFIVGSFEWTRLPSASVDAAMCIDALFYSDEKAAALSEFCRVLRAGGRIAITDWDYSEQPPGRLPQVEDHYPVVSAAGFEVVHYVETNNWRHHLNDVLDHSLSRIDLIAAEVGCDREELIEELNGVAATLPATRRRFLCIAEKPRRRGRRESPMRR